MKGIKKILSLLSFLLITQIHAFADEKPTFVASAPEAVVSGQQVRVSYTVNTQNIKDFRAPSFQGFELLMGPTRAVQSNTIQTNQGLVTTASITHTYILLAGEPGTYTIPAATIVANNQTLTSNTLTIKVLPPDQTGTNNAQNSGNRRGNNAASGNTTNSSTSVSDQEIFAIVTANKTNVYEQEALLITYKIYSLVDLRTIENQKLPDFKGFHSQEIDLPKPTKAVLEHYNGRNYNTFTIHQYVLFPQQSGQLEIPSAQFDVSIAKIIRSSDPFDAFFNGGRNYVEVKKSLKTPKLTINVNALPAGKPASFSGAVGNFSISSSINATDIKTNDAITLKVVLSGSGNMKLINNPDIDFPKDFEVYDPKVDNKFSINQGGLSGNKVIEYLAIPRHAGTYKIPAVEFSYFDLKSKTYKTLQTEAYEIKVERGEGNAEQVIANFTNKEDLRMIGSDIRFIKLNQVTYKPKGKFFFGSLSYLLWYIIPVCLFIIFLVIYRKQAVENANVAKVRTKKANKVATKRMKLAKNLLAQNKKSEFYDEVLKALWGYISDKLNIPVSQLSKDNIEYELTKYGVNEELIKEFIAVLNECEFARYAPGDEHAAMDNIYQSAIAVISKMENTIKH